MEVEITRVAEEMILQERQVVLVVIRKSASTVEMGYTRAMTAFK